MLETPLDMFESKDVSAKKALDAFCTARVQVDIGVVDSRWAVERALVGWSYINLTPRAEHLGQSDLSLAYWRAACHIGGGIVIAASGLHFEPEKAAMH